MNQQQSKRRKVQQNSESEHSWILSVPLVMDSIIQYLPAADIKAMFLVSKSWNQTLATSKVAMSHFVLKIIEEKGQQDRNLKRKTADFLKNSIRRFSKAKIELCYQPSASRAYELFDSFKSSLEEMEICFHGSFDLNFVSNGMCDLPKVRKASLINCSAEMMSSWIVGMENLQELELISCPNIFATIPMPAFKHRLTSFSFPSTLDQLHSSNIKHFLSSVSATLETLKLKDCSQEVFEFILQSLPKLKVLGIRSFNFVQRPGMITNKTITKFIAHTLTTGVSRGIPTSFMENLEVIEIPICTYFNMPSILQNCGHVRKIQIGFMHGSEIGRFYRRRLIFDPSIPSDIEFIHECRKPNCCGKNR